MKGTFIIDDPCGISQVDEGAGLPIGSPKVRSESCVKKMSSCSILRTYAQTPLPLVPLSAASPGNWAYFSAIGYGQGRKQSWSVTSMEHVSPTWWLFVVNNFLLSHRFRWSLLFSDERAFLLKGQCVFSGFSKERSMFWWSMVRSVKTFFDIWRQRSIGCPCGIPR